jgi:HSP20 family molecular chaperone IbpA
MFKPIDPFHPFQANHLYSQHHHHLPEEYTKHINGMVERHNQLMNEEFWESISNLQSLSHRQGSRGGGGNFPIELWETKDSYFLLAALPGLKKKENIKLHFENNDTLFLRVQTPSFKPTSKSTKVHSDFPDQKLERKINLPRPVSTKSYSVKYNEGIFSLTLTKINEEVEIPFDF